MGPLDSYLPYLLNRAGARIAAAFGEEMRPLGASLQIWRVLAMTEADYANPDVGRLMDEWLIGPGIDARRRLELMKLAWDMTGSEFGSRAGLYERLYSGDPEINAQRWFRSGITKECESLIHELLEQ